MAHRGVRAKAGTQGHGTQGRSTQRHVSKGWHKYERSKALVHAAGWQEPQHKERKSSMLCRVSVCVVCISLLILAWWEALARHQLMDGCCSATLTTSVTNDVCHHRWWAVYLSDHCSVSSQAVVGSPPQRPMMCVITGGGQSAPGKPPPHARHGWVQPGDVCMGTDVHGGTAVTPVAGPLPSRCIPASLPGAYAVCHSVQPPCVILCSTAACGCVVPCIPPTALAIEWALPRRRSSPQCSKPA
eukprot:320239-Pelagomonas_calceolata.AAC.2